MPGSALGDRMQSLHLRIGPRVLHFSAIHFKWVVLGVVWYALALWLHALIHACGFHQAQCLL